MDLPSLNLTGGVNYLPQVPVAPPTPAPAAGPVTTSNPISAGIAGFKAGGYGLASDISGAIGAGEKAVGLDNLSATAQANAKAYAQSAQSVIPQDVEKNGWTGGGLTGFLSKAAFEGGQLVPQVGAQIGGAVAAGIAAPEVAGAGLLAKLGPQFLGAAATAIPTSIGEQANAAAEQPGGLTQGSAIRAIVQGVPLGALQSLVPAEGAGSRVLGKVFGDAAESSIGRIAGRGFQDAAVMAVGSGAQQAANDSFDPNLSAGDRAANIVQAAVQGAATGGLLGSAFGGLEALHSRAPKLDGNASTVDLDQATSILNAPPPPEAPTPEAPTEAQAPTAPDQTASPPPTAPEPPEEQPDRNVAQGVAKDAGIKFSDKGAFGQFLQSLGDVKSEAELHNELLKLDPTDPATARLTGTVQFGKLADHLGVGQDLEAELADIQKREPDEAQAKALFDVQRRLGIRDAATALRPPEAPVKPAEPTVVQPALPPEPEPTDVTTPAVQPQPPPEQPSVAGPTTVEQTANTPTTADTGPQTIVDKVLQVARDAAPQGGPVRIQDIRDRLADQGVAPKDVDRALLDIHNDDSDSVLTQNAKGERKAPGGLKVPGLGTAHTLDLEPPVEAGEVGGADAGTGEPVRQSGATPEDLGGQPGAGPADGGGNAQGEAPAAPADADGGEGAVPGTASPASTTPDILTRAAQQFGVTLPERTAENAETWDATADKLYQIIDYSNRGQSLETLIGRARRGFGDKENPFTEPTTAPSQNAAPADFQGTMPPVDADLHPTMVGLGAYPSGHPDAAPWHDRVQSAVTDLSNQLGLKTTPRIYTQGESGPQGYLGLSHPYGQISIFKGLDEKQATNVALHELGHQVQFQKFDSAPMNVRRAILAEYGKHRNDPGSKDLKFGQTAPLTIRPAAHELPGNYITDKFSEWFAEQVSRWITTRNAPTSAVEKFFSGIAQSWKAIYAKVTGHVPLSKAVDDFMRGHWRGDADSPPPPDTLLSGAGADHNAAETAQNAATRTALAPTDTASPDRAAQVATKTKAAGNMLGNPTGNPEADQTLRKQTRQRTGIIKTPEGDQLPTTSVGGEAPDLPQAKAPSTDPLQPAKPPAPTGRTVGGRMPKLDNPTRQAPEEVKAAVGRVVNKLSPEMRSRVFALDRSADLPQDARDGLAARGVDPSKLPGVSHGGNLYIHSDQIRTRAEAQELLAPYVLASTRFNVSDPFGHNMARLLDKIAPEINTGNTPPSLVDHVPQHNVSVPLTPFEKARSMSSILASNDRKVWPYQQKAKEAVTNVLRHGGLAEYAGRILRMTPDEFSQWISNARDATAKPPETGQFDAATVVSDPRAGLMGMSEGPEPAFLKDGAGQQKDHQGVMGLGSSVMDRVGAIAKTKAWDSTVAGTRRVFANITPANGIAEWAKRHGLGMLMDHFNTGAQREIPARSRLDGVSKPNEQAHRDLKYLDRPQFDRLNKVMYNSALSGLDPRKDFTAHEHVKTLEPGEYRRQADLHKDLASEYNKLGQPGRNGKLTKGQEIFNTWDQLGKHQWFMNKSSYLWTQLRDMKGFEPGVDPATRYAGLDPTFNANSLHDDPTGSRAYSEAYYTDLTTRARQYYNDEIQKPSNFSAEKKNPETGKMEPDPASVAPHLKQLSDLLNQYDALKKNQIGGAPYFHIDRKGDYAVGFSVKPEIGADGKPTGRADPEALAALQKGYAKDFPQVAFSPYADSNRVFVRFENGPLADLFHKRVAEGGELREHIDPEAGTFSNTLDKGAHADGMVPFLDAQAQRIRQQFDADIAKAPPNQRAALEDARERALGNLRATVMDIMGDNTTRGLEAKREGVQGFSPDMLEAQASSATINARAATTNIFRQEKAGYLAQAQIAIDKMAKSDVAGAGRRAAQMQYILNAYKARDDASQVRLGSSLAQNFIRGLHTYTLGASPGYFFMQLAQLPTLTYPELAKAHGFAKSAIALAQSLGDTGRVLSAMARNGHLFHGGITEKVLADSGLPAATQKFLMGLVNRNHIELGSYSAANSGVEMGAMGRVQKFLHYANSTALLAEVAARLSSGLAAKRLFEGASPELKQTLANRHAGGDLSQAAVGYAGHTIDQSMFQWGSFNTPKSFTAGGFAGDLGPVLSKFHGFAPRLAEKIIRESLNGFVNKGGTDPQIRKEGQRFVGAHLAATMAMTGFLGLPGASWLGAVATRLSSLFGDGQGYDFENHFREFMANTFGDGMGEAISRGFPRYWGVDLKELGDGDLLPFTSLLEDRRKMEDAFPAYLAHAWGSGPSAMMNVALAAREMSEGRVMEGLARGLPTSLRNVARAYRQGEYGAMTSTGQRLPVDNTYGKVVAAALGYEPGDVAEVRDKQEAVSGLQDDLQYRRGNISREFLMARAVGDQAGQASALDDARKYDQDNPGQGFLRSFPEMIQQAAMKDAFARNYGTLGLKPKDIGGRGLIQY